MKFIHTADTHLRPTQYARLDRGDDFAKALENVVDKAIEAKVSVILHSGDLLDGRRPTSKVIHQLNAINHKLKTNNISMFVISGNHDNSEPHWADVIDVDHESGLVCVDNKRFSIDGVEILALPWMSQEAFSLRIEEEAPADILMWHYPIQEFAGIKGMEGHSMKLEDLPKNKFKAILMGDIHIHAQHILEDGTWVAMPGSTELCSSLESPCKFCDLYEVDVKGDKFIKEFTPIEITTRPVLKLSITSEKDMEAAIKQVQEYETHNPLIFIKHNPEIVDVFSRIASYADPRKCVIRCQSLGDKSSLADIVTLSDQARPVDFLENHIAKTDEVYGLGLALLDPGADAKIILDEYIAKEII